MTKPHDTPSIVAAEKGEVVLDGPDGITTSMTAEAAIETGHRLLDAGSSVLGQAIMDEARARELADRARSVVPDE